MEHKYNYVFVILHYITNDDTEKCIESIRKIHCNSSLGIVVVDNCSPNNKYDKLKSKYNDIPDIFWLQTTRNLGFANGNNYGYEFARNELNAEYIICINNDTEIRQNNFIDEITSLFIDEKYDILGPNIISIRDKGHQNPQELNAHVDVEIVLKKALKCLFIAMKYYFVKPKAKKNKQYDDKKIKELSFNYNSSVYNGTNMKLHGAAIIFSPSYVKKFKTAFDPRTFMYCEEDFLLWRSNLYELKMIYSCRATIYHKEFSSTQTMCEDKTNKQLRFKHINMFKSYIKLAKAILCDRRI